MKSSNRVKSVLNPTDISLEDEVFENLFLCRKGFFYK